MTNAIACMEIVNEVNMRITQINSWHLCQNFNSVTALTDV